MAFICLTNIILSYFSQSIVWFNHDVPGWCKQYCDEHWHDKNLNWNVSSTHELFEMLKGSFYYNPINPGLLKFLADKSREVYLINSVKNYTRKFSCEKIKDINFIRKIIVIGSNISGRESTLIVNTLLENKVTIGQLWNLCSLKLVDYKINYADSTLILDATEPLLKFYHSVKVCNYNIAIIIILTAKPNRL